MRRDDRFMMLAYDKTFLSEHPRFPVAAVLAPSSGNFLTFGTNRYKTHPMQGSLYEEGVMGPSIHAELAALLKARPLDVHGMRLTAYVCRRRKDGSTGLSKPCRICEANLKRFDITRVVYSIEGWPGTSIWYKAYNL